MASASSDYFIHDQNIRFRSPTGDRWFGDDTNKARLWQEGIASLLQPFSQANIPVLPIHTLPHFVNWDLYRCLGVTVWTDVRRCGRTTPLAEIREQQRLATDAETRAAAGLSGVRTVDLAPELCPDGMCHTNIESRWINRDGGHITVGEAEHLGPILEPLVTAGLRRDPRTN